MKIPAEAISLPTGTGIQVRSAIRSVRVLSVIRDVSVTGPDTFELVELAHFRTEEVDNDVACIDQHPVSICHAFDLGAAKTAFFQLAHQVISQRADVPGRAPGRDDHGISDGGFTAEIDNGDAFRLVVLKRVYDERLERRVVNAFCASAPSFTGADCVLTSNR